MFFYQKNRFLTAKPQPFRPRPPPHQPGAKSALPAQQAYFLDGINAMVKLWAIYSEFSSH